MNRRSLLMRAAFLASAVAGGFWLKDKLVWSRPEPGFHGDDRWHPLLRTASDVPVIDAVVNGRAVKALIDTGAQYSVLDARLGQDLDAPLIDMPTVAYGVGGGAVVGKGRQVDMTIANVRIEAFELALLDLGPLATDPSIGVGLVIGRDLMRTLVMELDWGQKRLRFLPASGWRASPDLFAAPVRADGDALAAEAIVEGRAVTAVVDTGASSLLSVTEPVAQTVGLLDGRRAEGGTSLVLGGMTQARWVRAEQVAWGERTWANARVAIFPPSPIAQAPDALLGMAAFKNKKLALNLGQSQLFVSRDLDLTVG
ncbi:aspartyl protease family protein [uncultured Brevundimonas sp.]|uniref:aspartyl protease family protein n=1 Tax=uncultured Brevundimonas sp. TaxID=213418 RepID=UPI00262F76B3|nr:aspartyl protease family protein [uncultured Brevundimonas sp.]